jgi:hypothetical protein
MSTCAIDAAASRPPAAVVLWSAKWQFGAGCRYRRARAVKLLRRERAAAERERRRAPRLLGGGVLEWCHA